jgi:hypothetical protein
VRRAIRRLHHNAGWVSVGTDHDTATFAVNAIRRWWRTIEKRHPSAKRPSRHPKTKIILANEFRSQR